MSFRLCFERAVAGMSYNRLSIHFIFKEANMKLSLAGRSILFFVLCSIILVLTTMAESALGVMSLGTQRILTLLGLVLPAISGAIFGLMSLARKEGRLWLAWQARC